jgi:hypothetical protein
MDSYKMSCIIIGPALMNEQPASRLVVPVVDSVTGVVEMKSLN